MPAVSKRFISLGSLTFFVAFLLISWCAPVQGAIRPVGEVILANGTFLAIQTDKSSRSLTRGSEFYQGDRLWTGPRSKAQIRFSDGAIMTLRADTEFRVDEYEFDNKNANRNKSLFTLVKGGFRTITGLISRLKPDSYKVKTAYAIVGVRGTTYETVVDNALYVAAWQGTVSVENEAGVARLGFGEDTNFARVAGTNRKATMLLEAPPQLLESVDPGLQAFVRDFQEVLEILPNEANIVRQGFAAFGADSTVSPGPLAGAGSDDQNGSPILVDPSSGTILRQGAASVVANANLPGVSWGAWAGGPAALQTVGGTTPVPSPVFWLTMAPATNTPTGVVAYNTLVGSLASGAVAGNPQVAGVTSFSATVNFGAGLMNGNMQVTMPAASTVWDASWIGAPLTGSGNNTTFNVNATGLINVATPMSGEVRGGFSGPGANTIGGVFDFAQNGDPTTHVGGVFVAQ